MIVISAWGNGNSPFSSSDFRNLVAEISATQNNRQIHLDCATAIARPWRGRVASCLARCRRGHRAFGIGVTQVILRAVSPAIRRPCVGCCATVARTLHGYGCQIFACNEFPFDRRRQSLCHGNFWHTHNRALCLCCFVDLLLKTHYAKLR
jgi:hypothetical protein